MKIQLARALINGASKAFHLLRKAELKRFNLTCWARKKRKLKLDTCCALSKAQQKKRKQRHELL